MSGAGLCGGSDAAHAVHSYDSDPARGHITSWHAQHPAQHTKDRIQQKCDCVSRLASHLLRRNGSVFPDRENEMGIARLGVSAPRTRQKGLHTAKPRIPAAGQREPAKRHLVVESGNSSALGRPEASC